MNQLSAYEIQRLKNIEYNKSVLRSLELPGLVSDFVHGQTLLLWWSKIYSVLFTFLKLNNLLMFLMS